MTITILTGAPGVGKSTAVIRAAGALKDRGLNVGGIVSKELRTNNIRVGFEFIDLNTNDTGVLASITGNGPKIGKYFVDLAGCRFAAERLCRAIKNCDVIFCDEIGPMELKSRVHRLRKEFTFCRQESNSCNTSQVTTSPNRAVQKEI
jgi:nucleoside-triphosphatase